MITKEKLQSHIDHLKQKHHEIDKILLDTNEQYDEHERITNLKKQKLQIKEEIIRLETNLQEN